MIDLVKDKTDVASLIAAKLVKLFKQLDVEYRMTDFPPIDAPSTSLWGKVRAHLEKPNDIANAAEYKVPLDKSVVTEPTLIATPLQLDIQGMPVSHHEQSKPRGDEVERIPYQRWIDSYRPTDKDVVSRLVQTAVHIVSNQFNYPLPLVVTRKKGCIEVRAVKDIPKRSLIVPLFFRKASSIVMEGDAGYDSHKTVAVEVSWEN